MKKAEEGGPILYDVKRDGWRVLNPLFFQVLLTPEKTRKALEQVLTDSAGKKSKVINDLRRWGLYIAYEDNILGARRL